jgi:ATP-binding protein involved in chromosome partitioning
MTANLQERVTDALSRIRNNRVGANVLEAEMIRDIATTTDGKVRLSLFLSADDDATVVREVRQTLQQVPGVTDVRVDVKDAAASRATVASPAPAPPKSAAPPPKSAPSRALPLMGLQPHSQRAAVPAPTPFAYPHLGNIVAISSGKGGVC